MLKKLFIVFGISLFITTPALAQDYYAEIIKVDMSKSWSSGYSIQATIKSSDKDCDHYVNWWEAVSEDGKLLYRRVLGHPHANEQPFKRGGTINGVSEDTVFYVRAHLHPHGYSNAGMKGSMKNGFTSVTIPKGFASALSSQGDKPEFCDPTLD